MPTQNISVFGLCVEGSLTNHSGSVLEIFENNGVLKESLNALSIIHGFSTFSGVTQSFCVIPDNNRFAFIHLFYTSGNRNSLKKINLLPDLNEPTTLGSIFLFGKVLYTAYWLPWSSPIVRKLAPCNKIDNISTVKKDNVFPLVGEFLSDLPGALDAGAWDEYIESSPYGLFDIAISKFHAPVYTNGYSVISVQNTFNP